MRYSKSFTFPCLIASNLLNRLFQSGLPAWVGDLRPVILSVLVLLCDSWSAYCNPTARKSFFDNAERDTCGTNCCIWLLKVKQKNFYSSIVQTRKRPNLNQEFLQNPNQNEPPIFLPNRTELLCIWFSPLMKWIELWRSVWVCKENSS